MADGVTSGNRRDVDCSSARDPGASRRPPQRIVRDCGRGRCLCRHRVVRDRLLDRSDPADTTFAFPAGDDRRIVGERLRDNDVEPPRRFIAGSTAATIAAVASHRSALLTARLPRALANVSVTWRKSSTNLGRNERSTNDAFTRAT